ncbi:hypothetical protein EB796_021226 [Bugula neritina]|uniref:FBF1 n=1 Tax=Bugula neritina TaxID=10212 RepID=A0A7J7J4W0_BUGNE|nr:hypothetical protein EB796_021226 [Bugula neritina]
MKQLFEADENFYSSLAAGVSDGSDSDADPTILAKSLGGLDDLDNDIFGSLNSKKKPVAKQPALKKTPATSSSASKEVKKSSFNIDDIMGGDDDDLDTLLSGRPKTTDDTKKSSASSDLFGEAKQRPATTGQSRKPAKKVEFGEFDPDDPLGDLDLSDDDDFGLKKKPTPAKSAPSKARPVTRSGNRPDDSAQTDDGSDWDASSASSTSKKESEKPAQPALQAQPSQSQAKPKKKETITFSDDEGDLDLGLDDMPQPRSRPLRNSVEKHLQRPGTGDSQREFNISVRASIAESNKSSKKISDEDDDIFGSYAPSVMSSRPGTGRSVRFEDEEPTQKRPATADAAFTAADDDWLGLGVGSSKEKKRPLGLSSTVDFSGTRSQSSSDDWLDMATGSSSRPKTAPVATEKKPPRSPERKPVIGGSKIGGGDDWLAELSAKVDEDTDFTSRHKPGRRLSTDKTTSRQSSVESTGNTSRRPSLVKQSSADDWLGLGAEAPIEPPAKPMSQTPAGSRPASKSTVKPSPVIDDSDWLGLGSSTPTKDDEAEDWIKAAKLKRQQSADNSLLDPGASRASGTFSLTTEKPATQEVTSFPWEKGGSSTPPKANLSVTGPQTIPSQTLSAAHSIPTSSQPVFQPMFTSLPVPPQPTVNLDSASWNREQESLVKQHQVQLEQMQSQFNQMMEARRQQQQSALHQQMKLAEEAFKLQQQQLQSSISGLGPSAVFPSGLSPTKQSEVQLNNVELESQVKSP